MSRNRKNITRYIIAGLLAVLIIISIIAPVFADGAEGDLYCSYDYDSETLTIICPDGSVLHIDSGVVRRRYDGYAVSSCLNGGKAAIQVYNYLEKDSDILYLYNGENLETIADSSGKFIMSADGSAVAYYVPMDEGYVLYLYRAGKSIRISPVGEVLTGSDDGFCIAPDGSAMTYPVGNAYMLWADGSSFELSYVPVALSSGAEQLYLNGEEGLIVQRKTKTGSAVMLREGTEGRVMFNRDFSSCLIENNNCLMLSSNGQEAERLVQGDYRPILAEKTGELRLNDGVTAYDISSFRGMFYQPTDYSSGRLKHVDEFGTCRTVSYGNADSAVTADNEKVYFLSDGNLCCYTTENDGVFEELAEDVESVLISSDGNSVYYVSGEGKVMHYVPGGGSLNMNLPEWAETDSLAVFGNKLVFSDCNKKICVTDPYASYVSTTEFDDRIERIAVTERGIYVTAGKKLYFTFGTFTIA